MKDIFISYSRKDSAFVASLRRALEIHDLEAWRDIDDIPPAARWRPEIAGAIESHGSFIFVISPDSLHSEECLKELQYAVECGKRLIPILRRAEKDMTVPRSLADLNWTMFDDEARFERSVEQLVSAVQTDLEWNRDLARLLVQARRWDTRQRNDSFVLRGLELQDALHLLARAEMGKTPRPTPLQEAYIEASKVHEASEIQRWKEKLYEANYNLANVFEEQATGALAAAEKSGDDRQYEHAWLCSLAAVSKIVGPDRELPISVGRLMLPEVRINAFRELWRTERPTELVEESFTIPEGQGDSRVKQDEWRYDVPSGDVGNVIFDKDGSRLALVCGDNAIRFWSTSNGHEIQRLIHRPFAMESWNPSMKLSSEEMNNLLHSVISRMTVIAFAPVDRLMASGLSDGRILLWDAVEGCAVVELKGHQDAIISVAFHPNGQLLAAASRDGLVSLWSIGGLSVIHHAKFASANRLAFSPDGALLAVASNDSLIRLVGGMDLEHRANLAGHTGSVTSLTFSARGTMLASASKDQTVRLWETQGECKQVAEFTGHTSVVLDVAFSADGKLLASGDADGHVRLWHVDSKTSAGILTRHRGSVVSVTFSPSSPQLLVSVSSDHTLCLWQSEERRLLARWSGHLSTVNAVAISPRGDRVASGAGDGTIRLWHATTGEELTVLHADTSWVTSVAFSPDGKLLASS